MRHWKAWLFLALALWAGWSWWGSRPVARAAGVIAPGDPVQVDFDAPQPPIALEDATLHPLARFSLTARVLSREDYRFDAEAALSPTDLALGWGRMSDSDVLQHIDISQSGRFYYWHVQEFPIPRREIETSSANMHMIPADADVKNQLEQVRAGQVIHLEGFLVDATRPGGWHWKTSMTRDDTGAGACELIYVERVDVVPAP